MTLALYLFVGAALAVALDLVPEDDGTFGVMLTAAAACIALWPLVAFLFVTRQFALMIVRLIDGGRR